MARKLGTAVRKQQIAQAALSLVSSHGVKELSIAGIASRVGLVPSAVYRHFKNKDQVIEAILDLIEKNLLENVKVVVAATPEPLARLHLLLQLHMQLIQDNQGILRLVFSEEVMHGPPARKAAVQSTVATYLKAVAGLVHQGQEEAVILGDLAAEAVAVAFLGMIQPAAILWHLSAGRYDLAAHTAEAWNIFLGGIVAPPAPTPGPSGNTSPESRSCYPPAGPGG